MGCIGSTSRNLQQPTFSAILTEIFELVPREETLKEFNKKSEIMKYFNEFDWAKIQPQFKLEVKTLIDHIESYKIRLIDSALYVESKIKLSQNPIIIKMCMHILQELILNLDKFIQLKEIPVQNQIYEESKIEISQRSIQIEHLQTLTQVSDNFLKFELAFSNIISQLINDKMTYAMVWWGQFLETLESFSNKKANKQFQSENIQCILTFLEYIIGTKLGYSDQFEWVTKTNEEMSAVQELLDLISDPFIVMSVYKNAFLRIPQERLFVTKSQKALFNILMKDHKKFISQPIWHKLTETFLERALNQQLYEELFLMLFNNFDEDYWKNPQDIFDITYIVLEVAKQINQLSNTELFIFTKLVDYLDTPNDKNSFESPSAPPLLKKTSEYKNIHVTSNVKNSVIKLLINLFNSIETNQFILFQQTQTIKAILNNLRANPEIETFNDTKLCLIALLKQISSDTNSVQLFIQQILAFAYNYNLNLINNTAINIDILINLLIILHECIQKIETFNSTIIITEEMIVMLIEIAEFDHQISLKCAQILTSLFLQAGKINSNENNEINSYLVPNSNIIGLSAYFLSNSVLISYNEPEYVRTLINQFFDFIPGRLNNQQIVSIIAYIIDDSSIKQGNSKLSKSNRKINFDTFKDKELRLCMIIKLISYMDDEISKDFNELLYSFLGAQFQIYKKKGFGAYQDLQILLSKNNINTEIQEILSKCNLISQIDFEKIKKQFKDNLSNQNNQNGIINLDDIQVKEDIERGSILNQSFQAPSHIEVQLDESFEQQLQTIKKQKMKQEKLEHLTTEQREMMEY
ncbi:unnamed protein product [Paramecium pentaurelia]|uniref:Uncharacterized protein n=1 Tax=Paramecium pentaurelia TaxID=43138 RepID=A0A8S1SKB0_9CILI|nr:unnamed protein product [Paramecium pentaurelia]